MSDYCMKCMSPMQGKTICPVCGYDPSYTEVLTDQLVPGTYLQNHKYVVGKALGQGGFGITYIARDTTLDLRVAIKEFFPHQYAHRQSVKTTLVTMKDPKKKSFLTIGKEKFLNEARALASCSMVPGIVTVREYFEENNTAYIAMDFLNGIDLRNRIKQKLFTSEEIFQLMNPLFHSLATIHKKGLIHRDISPDNIMLMPDGTLTLMDFGAARRSGGYQDEEGKFTIILKPGYAPLEQYSLKGKQGPWTDIYALCATIYKCITGKTPPNPYQRLDEIRIGNGDPLKMPSELRIEISKNQEEVLRKGLEIEIEDRLQTMEDLLKKLQEDPPKKISELVERLKNNKDQPTERLQILKDLLNEIEGGIEESEDCYEIKDELKIILNDTKDDSDEYCKIKENLLYLLDGMDPSPQNDRPPKIFAVYSHNDWEFNLDGEQTFGRKTKNNEPDLSINVKSVSRKHGVFYSDLENKQYCYKPEKSTNGTLLNGSMMVAGQKVELHDGDILAVRPKNQGPAYDVSMIFSTNYAEDVEWRYLGELGKNTKEVVIGRQSRSGMMRGAFDVKFASLFLSSNGWVLIDHGKNKLQVNHEIVDNARFLKPMDIIRINRYYILFTGQSLLYQTERSTPYLAQIGKREITISGDEEYYFAVQPEEIDVWRQFSKDTIFEKVILLKKNHSQVDSKSADFTLAEEETAFDDDHQYDASSLGMDEFLIEESMPRPSKAAKLFSINSIKESIKDSIKESIKEPMTMSPAAADVEYNQNPSGKGNLILIIGGMDILEGVVNRTEIREEASNHVSIPENSELEREYRRTKNRIVYVSKDDNQNSEFTVYQLISDNVSKSGYDVEDQSENYQNHINDILYLFNLNDQRDLTPGQLQYSQKRFLKIAVEYALDPDLMYIDSPTDGMDLQTSRRMIRLLRELANRGKIVILTSNRPDIDSDLYDQILVVNKDPSSGKRVMDFSGTKDEVFRHYNAESLEEVLGKIVPQNMRRR